MYGNKNMSIKLDESVSDKVTFGDSSQISVKRTDMILFRSKDGRHQYISNVYYVPSMKYNILSLGQLLKKGYDNVIKDRTLSIRDHLENLIAKVQMTKNRMFLSNIQTDVAKCLKACFSDSNWLWHLNFGALDSLGKRKW